MRRPSLATVPDFLDSTPCVHAEADRWRRGDAASMVRAEPVAKAASKVLVLRRAR
jgi:hypothetical protein